MIRFNVTYNQLLKLIKEHDDSWLNHAQNKTETFRQLGKYEEGKNIWRRVVRVYMNLQHNKCPFCERKLEGAKTGGTREFDIEHFRPKSSVNAWPSKKIIKEFKLPADFPRSAGSSTGYYLLPYHPLNYTVSCKPCNSSLKSNYFPIKGERDLENDDPRQLGKEKPYLVYPLGDNDEDPEKIIKYNGVMAVPVSLSGHNYDRARVIIVFFRLNVREGYFAERAEKISHMFQSLENYHCSPSQRHRKLAKRAIAKLTSEKSPHTNCARSFKKLYETNKPNALKMIDGIMKYLESAS
ncbi:MAG: hypothetical protein GY940_03590 [bacterium]|nr:hypothetical protein [bacterium]